MYFVFFGFVSHIFLNGGCLDDVSLFVGVSPSRFLGWVFLGCSRMVFGLCWGIVGF